ncbi:MAG: prepilin-type N-terminal cleavage/methylation domain-containing protein [Paucibacter sp.]|nr:prepilin-type N-terminal cleavage/methylation domain-containing protein [Roseateles sp.]
MRTSAAGSERGFTLIELLIVLTIVAASVAAVSLALRDPLDAQLERESERLAALLEMARADARADGLPVSWAPLPPDAQGDGSQFRFTGLPKGVVMPSRWLGNQVQVQVLGATRVQLGPEPFIGAQRIVLSLGEHRRVLTTDGLAPFSVAPDS